MLSSAFIKDMREKLLAAKQKLEGDLAGLSSHTELGSDIDSNAQEVEDDEVSQDMIARINSDLEKINKALAKIEAGNYGIGDDGAPIPEERLKAMPWAERAI